MVVKHVWGDAAFISSLVSPTCSPRTSSWCRVCAHLSHGAGQDVWQPLGAVPGLCSRYLTFKELGLCIVTKSLPTKACISIPRTCSAKRLTGCRCGEQQIPRGVVGFGAWAGSRKAVLASRASTQSALQLRGA